MLDGLLGRSGFYSKCKSLIKQTRTRIDVVKRKRSATQKFLRKDIADLLADGLERNAYGRADGLITELILSSCYDFVDQVCEIILKHLPVLQKLRDCPEDCREAVASLMFAAARFSDLPELRELRDLFQERYSSSLECFVNQKLVENLTPKPPSMEKKVQLMQEIASEYSIRWDSWGFEERMNKSSATEKNQRNIPGIVHAASENKVSPPCAVEIVHKEAKDDVFMKRKSEAAYQNKEREVDNGHQIETLRNGNLGRGDDLKRNAVKGPEFSADRYKPPSHREETVHKREENDKSFYRRGSKANIHDPERNGAREAVQVGTSSHAKMSAAVDSEPRRDKQKDDNVLGKDLSNTLSRHKPDLPINNSPSTFNRKPAEDFQVRSTQTKQEDGKDASKSSFRNAIPPPYVKPRRSKQKADIGSQQNYVNGNADENDTLTFNPVNNGNRSEKAQPKSNPPDGAAASDSSDGQVRFTEIYYRDASSTDFTPRRRSHRKKHSRSSSIQDDKANHDGVKEEERVVRRVSTSRRKHESRKGLQILFDDDHHKRDDEEERMIDKLLLHYSKKPSSADPGKPRRENNSKAPDTTKRDDEDSTPTTSRSMSLPSRKVTEPEPKKVIARAASFQPETPAKHVHPKLPDYDDFVAKLASLRASKD